MRPPLDAQATSTVPALVSARAITDGPIVRSTSTTRPNAVSTTTRALKLFDARIAARAPRQTRTCATESRAPMSSASR